jgi:hypothetical protein
VPIGERGAACGNHSAASHGEQEEFATPLVHARMLGRARCSEITSELRQ